MNVLTPQAPVSRMRRMLAMVAASAIALTGAVLAQTAVAAPAHAAPTVYTHFDGETVAYDTEAVIGEPIRLTGTGWLAKPDMVDEGEEGSVIGFKLIDSTAGQLERTFALDNPRLGEPVTNTTVWGTVWAESDGSFEIELPWPDASNAVTDPQWSAGDSFTVQLLSGTMYSDQAGVDPSLRPDVSRTVALTIAVVADGGGEEPAGPLAVAAQPQPAAAANGAEAGFTAASSGGAQPVTVQWQRSTSASASTAPANYVNLTAANTLDGSFAAEALRFIAGQNTNTTNRWYRAVFTDADGATVTTEPAKLSIVAVPTVTQNPAGQTISVGETATFVAAGTSTVEIATSWQTTRTALPNGEPDGATWAAVAGVEGDTLTVAGVDAEAQHGTFYRAVFTNVSGSAYSQPVQLRFFEKLDTNAPITVTGTTYGPAGTEPKEFSVSAPSAVVWGEDIVIEGFNYLAVDGVTGSISNGLIDAEYSGDPRTLSTTRIVYNPQTGAVYSDKRGHNVVQAGGSGGNAGGQTIVAEDGSAQLVTHPEWAPGYFRVVIPWPDETNTTQTAEFFAENWAPGSQHTVRFLTGSLLTPSGSDYQGGISVRFTVVEEPTGPVAVAPEVTGQPADVSVVAGEDASFIAAATGEPAPSVRWESSTDGENWTPVAGATAATLDLTAVTPEQSGTHYRAVFSNDAGSDTSAAATLTVTPATPVLTEPTVTLQFADTTATAGESASFTFRLEGPAGWELELAQLRVWNDEFGQWIPVPGSNNATAQALPVEHTFVTSPLTLDDSGRYSARYRVKDADGNRYVAPGGDASGWTLIDPATLTVVAPSNLVETPVLSGGAPAGTLITPKTVVVGESITISGTGFFLSDGSGGSGGPIFINQPSGGTGPVSVAGRTIENQIPGSSFADPRAHGVFHSDAEGNWSITIPFPTPENSTLTEETAWQAGQTQSIRILTGSLVAGDQPRSAAVEFTVVGEPPVITQQPTRPDFVLEGQNAQLSVVAENADSYQWQRHVSGAWIDLDPAQYPGADTDTLRFEPVLAEHYGIYRVVVAAAGGETIASDDVDLIASAGNVTIVKSPGDLAVDAGDDVVIEAEAFFPQRGSEPQLYLQEAADVWNPTELDRVQLDEADLVQRIGSHTFVLESVSADMNGAQLRVCAYMTEPGGGSGTCSTRFTLTVNGGEPSEIAPEITTQPGDVSVEVGEEASFTAAASGDPVPTVQWESSTDGENWTPVAGATEATLSLSTVSLALSGTQYRAVFTNAAGSATSNAATLTVTEPTEPEPQDPSLNYTPVNSNTNGQPAGTLITPKEIVLGEPITISGTGWFLQNGDGGSAGPIFINQPSGGTGPVNVSGRTIENQIPGSTYGDARAHGVWMSDDEGNWSITIPFPTPENSTLTEETAWQVGQTQSIRILTGSLAAGDHSRNPFVEFTIVSGDEGPTGQIDLTAAEVAQHGHVWFNLADFAPGSDVVVELVDASGGVLDAAPFTIGEDGNTANPDGQTYRRVTVPRDATPGSDYAVRVKDAQSGEVLATSSNLTVVAAETVVFNPGDHDGGVEDLLVQRGGTWTFHAVGFAPNGTLTATAEVDGETVTLSGIGQISSSELAWQLDANGDTLREPVFTRVQIPASVAAGPFEVTFSDGPSTVTRTLMIEAPEQAAVTVAPSADLGGTIRVTGEGFMHPNGSEGSTIAIKINDGAYSRVDSSTHANRTIWWIVEADEYGNFAIDMPVPNGTTADDGDTLGSAPAVAAGEGFTLRFLTGSLKAGDLSRTLQSTAFSITDPTPVAVAPAITTQPTAQTVVAGQDAVFTAAASGDPAPTVQWESSIDGVVWTPVAGADAATLTLSGLAVDQSGAQYRAVFTNTAGSATTDAATLTVRPQAAVTVAPTAEMGGTIRVTGEGFFHPSSTERGSRIGIKIDEGAYSRLDGSVHGNRTIWAIVDAGLDGTFEIDLQLPDGTTEGANGSTPAFVAGTHSLRLLTGSLLAGDTSRTLLSDTFTVTAPEPVETAPVVTTQPSGASVREGEDAVFIAAASGAPEPTVQWESGIDGENWAAIDGATGATLTLPAVTPSQSGLQVRAVFTNSAGSATTAVATLTVTPATVDPEPNPQPDYTPQPPVADGDDLPAEFEGEVLIQQSGNTAWVTVPGAAEGEWFFVYAYSTPTPLGWHQADANSRFLVDLSSLSPGEHRLAVLDADGQLVGWAPVVIAAAGGQPGGGSGGTGLPVTGAEAAMPIVALGAAALLALGVLAAGASVRRRLDRRAG